MNARTLIEWRTRRDARRSADRWLLAHRRYVPAPAEVERRVAELTAARHRLRLAGSLRDLLDDLDRRLPGASRVNRRAARANAALIEELASRLADLADRVDAAAVLRTERLLADGSSPLYAPEAGADLRPELRAILAGLER